MVAANVVVPVNYRFVEGRDLQSYLICSTRVNIYREL